MNRQANRTEMDGFQIKAMKASILPIIVAALAFTTAFLEAQTSSSVPPVSSQTIQETQQNQEKKGKVILSRSIDENGQTVDGPSILPEQAPPAHPPSQAEKLPKVKVAASSIPDSAEDAERSALTYTDFDFDVRLRPAESHLAVRALITLRNDSKRALTHLPLQLSSSLDWELIRLNGHQLPYTVAILNSDADHTGQLHEAAIAPAQPLAPGAERIPPHRPRRDRRLRPRRTESVQRY